MSKKKLKPSRPTSVRLNPIAACHLRILQDRYGISQSRVIEMGIMHLPIPETREEKTSEQTPC